MSKIIKIGIAGRMRTGKTTVAKYLVERYGFFVTGFAESIKDIARQVGWDGNKDERGRTLLQELGTVVRHYNASFWIDKTLAELPAGRNIVIDDMRMVLEHERLCDAGFETLMIKRNSDLIKDATPANIGHITEVEVDLIKSPWLTIENNSSIEDLHKKIDNLMLKLKATK